MSTPRLCNRTPNSVTLNITYGSPFLCFLPHAPYHLCYDGGTHAYAERAPGREEMQWTSWRSWIR